MAEMSAASAPASITVSFKTRPVWLNATIRSHVKIVAATVPQTANARIAPIRVKKRSRGSEKPASKMMCGSRTAGDVGGVGVRARKAWSQGGPLGWLRDARGHPRAKKARAIAWRSAASDRA